MCVCVCVLYISLLQNMQKLKKLQTLHRKFFYKVPICGKCHKFTVWLVLLCDLQVIVPRCVCF